MRPFLDKSLSPASKTLEHLLLEIDRQIALLIREQGSPEDKPEKGIIALQEQDDTYRENLANLHAQILAAVDASLGTAFPLLEKALLWKIPTFCATDSKLGFIDPDYMKERCTRIQSTRGAEESPGDTIWKDRELLEWASAEISSVLLVQGSPGSVHQSQRFSTELCTYLETHQPTVYMLNGPNLHGSAKLNEADLLRQLALQALKKLSVLPRSDRATILADIVYEFRRVSSTKDWFTIMGRIIKYFPEISVIVDVDVLGRAAEEISQRWPEAFNELCATVDQSTLLRVVLLGSRRFSSESAGIRAIRLSRTAYPSAIQVGIRQRGVAQRSIPLYVRRKASSSHDLPKGQRIPVTNQQLALENATSPERAPANTGVNDSIPTATRELTSTSATQAHTTDAPLPPNSRQDFKIAIICALTRPEADAVDALFDIHWDARKYGQAEGDTNAYSMGLMSRHNVVLVYMPIMGKSSASNVAANCRISFPGIKLALVVGICGGVPFAKDGTEILLGDIVISDGIILYDFGRQYPDGFERKDSLLDNASKPAREISSMLAKLKGLRGRKGLQERTFYHLKTYSDELQDWAKFPGVEEDKLFESVYQHKHQDPLVCARCTDSDDAAALVCDLSRGETCETLKCDLGRLVVRRRHETISEMVDDIPPKPVVHFGLYASGDKVMKSGVERDKIAKKEGIVAFEMEGAGVWDTFPCLIIKGVCDYSDSHKNKRWQNYAAVTAASCAKAFLEELPTYGGSNRA